MAHRNGKARGRSQEYRGSAGRANAGKFRLRVTARIAPPAGASPPDAHSARPGSRGSARLRQPFPAVAPCHPTSERRRVARARLHGPRTSRGVTDDSSPHRRKYPLLCPAPWRWLTSIVASHVRRDRPLRAASPLLPDRHRGTQLFSTTRARQRRCRTAVYGFLLRRPTLNFVNSPRWRGLQSTSSPPRSIGRCASACYSMH